MAGEKILIVEDEYIVGDVLKRTFERKGYVVPSIAVSGESAVKLAEETIPDLIIMDISLKGTMDGIEAAKEIHNRADVPILFLTAYEDEEIFERAKSTEPFGYLLKPLDEKEIIMSVEVALNKDKMEKERQKLLDEIKILRGILPICSHCKKIRNDEGYWQEVVEYIRKHSEAEFSHGICPDCSQKYYSEFLEDGDAPDGEQSDL
ncbi:response regulator [Candidatus Omnitrophota bacterium]